MKTLFFSVLLSLPCLLAAQKLTETVPQNERILHAENDYVRISLMPQGGQLQELLFKPTRTQFAAEAGMGTEYDWKITSSRQFLRTRPFTLSSKTADGSCALTAVGQHVGGGIDFLRSKKTFTMQQDSAVITVDYELTNMPEAMSATIYALQLHYHLQPAVKGAPLDCMAFFPLKKGIAQQADLAPVAPSRDWMAIADGKGTGLAITMHDFAELDHVYSWKGNNSQTLEYFITPLKLEPNQAWKTRVELIPFMGMNKVSGAGHGLVGELEPGKAAPDGTTPVTMKIYSGRKGELDARVMLKTNKKGLFREVSRHTLSFEKPATVKNVTFTIPTPADSLTEIEVILRFNGLKAARLNASVVTGKTEHRWRMQPLALKRPSSLKEMPLTNFTSIYPFKNCVPWGKPLAGGKLKLLSIVNYLTIPELMYLGNHLDLELSHPILIPGKDNLEIISYMINEYSTITVDRQLQDIHKELKKDYDVILVGGQYGWSCLPKTVQKKILGKIHAGCGLVMVGSRYATIGLEALGKSDTPLRMPIPETVKPNHYLVSGIPLSKFSAARTWAMRARGDLIARAGTLPFVSVLSHGKGRIVSLNYATGNNATIGFHRDGIGPEISYQELLEGSPHPFYYSLLGKAVTYASGRSIPVEFQRFSGASQLVWSLKLAKPFTGTVELRVTNRFHHLLQKQTMPVNWPQAGLVELKLPLPTVTYHGGLMVNAIVRDEKGNSVNWGSWPLEQPKNMACITELKTNAANYHDGDTIAITGKLDHLKGQETVRIELEDSYKRILAAQTMTAQKTFSLSFKVDNQLPARYAVVRARLLRGKTELDAAQREIWLRPKEELLAWNDFEIYTGWPSYLPLYLAEERNDMYRRELCCTGLSAIENGRDTKYARHFNFLLIGGATGNYAQTSWDPKEPKIVREYRRTGNKMLLKNPSCMSNPKRTEWSTHVLKKTAREGYDAGITVYMGADETSLTGRWGKDIDYCFSEFCLKRFRTWLHKRYGSLDNINAAWQTNFKTMEEVLPFTIEEIRDAKGQHIAGWADHLEFMDSVWAHALDQVSTALKTRDKNAIFGQSGTPSPRAYGGMDWWKQMKAYDFCSGYSHGGQAELRRSFKRPSYRGMNWSLGYGAKPEVQIPRLWRAVFIGYKGVNSFTTRSMSRPDWTIPHETKAVQPHMRTLIQGTGKFIVNWIREDAPVALILYSQASIRSAFYRKNTKEHEASRLKFISMFRNLGLAFKFISYEQLAQGELSRMPSVKLLALPDSDALSDAECAEIRAFVERGGAVMAEQSMPGLRQENCVPRAKSPLADLFDGTHPRVSWSPKPDEDYLNFQNNIYSPYIARQIEKRLAGVTKLLSATGTKLAPVPRYPSGALPENAEFFRYCDRKGNPLLCMLSSFTSPYHQQRNGAETTPGKTLVYRLTEKRHLYDLVENRYLGFGNSFNIQFSTLKPHALLALPHKVDVERFTAKGNTLNLTMTSDVDTVVRVTVYDPSGKERQEYARNQLVRDGQATWNMPFCLSDPKGTWTVKAKDVLSSQITQTTVIH